MSAVKDRVAARIRRIPAGRRRLLVRGGVVAALLLALVVLPGYLATRPSYLQRYPRLRAEYRTWSTSVHAQVACQKCHVAPGLVPQTVYAVRMIGWYYASPVLRGKQPGLLGKPTNAACSSCHIDLRTVSPSGDLNIPHRAHVNVLKIECVKCHAYLVHEKSPEGKHKPRMATCLTCHDGVRAKNACATCHTSKGRPADHRAADWDVVHSLRQKQVDCAKCHGWTKNWCAECHSRRPASHAGKWRTNHRLRVEKHRNCEVCHAAPFCVRCHGEVPQLNFDPRVRLVK